MGELDKLEAFGEGRAEITAEDVAAVLGRGLGQPLYLLGDAFAARDAPTASSCWSGCWRTGEEGRCDPGALHRALRQVRGAARCARRERPGPRSRRACCPRNMLFKLDALLEGRAPLDRPELGAALDALGRADRRNEAGSDAAVALTSAVVAALRGTARRLGARRRSALTLRVRRLLYRAAALSWITPFLAALSISPTVSGEERLARLASPLAMAARSFLTWVLSWETFCRLRARRLTPCLICFRADA